MYSVREISAAQLPRIGKVIDMPRRSSNESIPADARAEAIASLKACGRVPVVIVGGGINGIATFRDLALQGVDAVLVERNDWSSGASAASSHMIHGGIRYLENGEFRLVRESVQERNGLLKTAPHYVKPLKTTVPIFSTFSGLFAAPLRFLRHRTAKPSERGAILIKAGLVLYDSFSRGGGQVPRHTFVGRARSRAELPKLNRDVKYTATYFDASVHAPERLALDVLNDGMLANPNAIALNYVEAVGLDDSGVLLRDRETGDEFSVAADVVINASGPWTDLTNAAFGRPSTFMGGTKGSHIVLDSPELLAACDERELFFEHSDGRIVLIYPLRGRVLVGTTDLETDITAPAVCTEAEVDYFFDLIRHVFPDVQVSRSDIVFRFAGIRPLPRHDDTQPGFVSRDYRIESAPAPSAPDTTVLSLVGGKWTTFRALAEHLTDEALSLLGRSRVVSTARMPIGGGIGFPATDAAHAVWIASHADEVGPERAEALLARYGTRAHAVIEASVGLVNVGPIDAAQVDQPLVHAPSYRRAEIEHIARTEHVVHLTDVVLRRTDLAFSGGVTRALLGELGQIVGEALGWDAERQDVEIRDTAKVLTERHGVVGVSEAAQDAALQGESDDRWREASAAYIG
jgi:glycerol-3-phosphate dehydrogenase